jgi:hypothetical protein
MNKSDLIKAQGKATLKAGRANETVALVIDTTTLYSISNGSFYEPRWRKTVKTVCKNARTESTGWLTLSVPGIAVTAEEKANKKRLENWIRNFNGSVSDIIDAKGHLIEGAVPTGISLTVENTRDFAPRVEVPQAPVEEQGYFSASAKVAHTAKCASMKAPQFPLKADGFKPLSELFQMIEDGHAHECRSCAKVRAND